MKSANIIRPAESWKGIERPDEHLATYIYQKQVDPDSKIMLRAFERRVVDKVDTIVELAHGERDFIKSDSDWKVAEQIIDLFAQMWPNEWAEFCHSVNAIKLIKGEGMSRTEEIKHVGSIPPRLMKLLKVIFPAQQWDKNFTNKFVKRFPLFKVGDRINKKYY